ncbi:MAG: hypothetical protein JWQ07_4423 [Ramlibacter sp.]|nr:hypothetical protein [Ramlibacter sp.]
MRLRRALVLAAFPLLCATASAQDAAHTLAVACPKAAEVTEQHLFGLWRAEFEGLPQGATLLLERHPDLPESVRGAINRDGERAEVSGDVDEGEFTLEESVNGMNISATWLGEVVEGSCGREIRGTWQAESDRRARGFVLRKADR